MVGEVWNKPNYLHTHSARRIVSEGDREAEHTPTDSKLNSRRLIIVADIQWR